MGFLESMLGGVVGAEALQLVEGAINKQGGVQGLMAKFQSGGLEGIVQSWVGNGANQTVSPQQVQQAIGADTLSQLAADHGMSVDQVTAFLAEHLPSAIDKLTPNGTV